MIDSDSEVLNSCKVVDLSSEEPIKLCMSNVIRNVSSSSVDEGEEAELTIEEL